MKKQDAAAQRYRIRTRLRSNDTASAAGSRTVTATLLSPDFTPTGGASFSNCILPTTATGAGTINQKTVTAAIIGDPTRVYDGGTTSALASANYTLSGFVSGQGATVTQTSGTYDSTNAGSRTVTAALPSIDFTQNNGTNLANYVLPMTASGAGTINQKTLTAAITGNPTRTYDSTPNATLAPGDYTLSGFVNGQGATVTQTAGSYDLADAGSRTVTAALPSADFSQNGGTNLANYILPTTASGAGAINQKTLTAAITGNPTRIYDGTASAALGSGDYTLNGFVTGQGATVSQTSGVYDAADAGSRTVTAALLPNDLAPNSGTNLANYVLPAAASGLGTIGQKTVTAAITGTTTKSYDGTTSASLVAGDFTLNGFITGQGATVTQSAGTYNTAEAGSHTVTATLTGTNFTPEIGTNLANYSLPGTASGAGTINQKTLTAAITGLPVKTYDGTTAVALTSSNYIVNGFVSGEGATVVQPEGLYDSADAGARGVSTTLQVGNFIAVVGTKLGNYVLPSFAAGIGTITQRPLTAVVVGGPTKIADGTTAAPLSNGNFSLTGFIAGQGATVNQSSGAYDFTDAGSRIVTASLAPQNFQASTGTLLSNYLLPLTATGAGTITPATVTNATTLTQAIVTNLAIGNTASANQIATMAARAVFGAAVPRTYIPYPAPSTLSTWQNNGFGSLPTIVYGNAAPINMPDRSDGTTSSGSPVINTTEQILLQGGKNKSWHIVLPPTTDKSPDAGSGR